MDVCAVQGTDGHDHDSLHSSTPIVTESQPASPTAATAPSTTPALLDGPQRAGSATSTGSGTGNPAVDSSVVLRESMLLTHFISVRAGGVVPRGLHTSLLLSPCRS